MTQALGWDRAQKKVASTSGANSWGHFLGQRAGGQACTGLRDPHGSLWTDVPALCPSAIPGAPGRLPGLQAPTLPRPTQAWLLSPGCGSWQR